VSAHTDEQKRQILADADATSAQEAARRAGVSERTLRRWRVALGQDVSSSPVNAAPNNTTDSADAADAADGADMSGMSEWPPAVMALTLRQRAFVLAYTGQHFGNATRSAMAAGYQGSYGSVAVTAHNLLKNAKIQAAIEQIFQSQVMTSNEARARLSRMARGQMGDFLNPEDPREIDLERAAQAGALDLVKRVKTRRVVTSTRDETVETVTVELELHDPQAAIDKLLRSSGAYKDQVQISGEVTRKIVVVIGEEGDEPGEGEEQDAGSPEGQA
jgi:hypothetical protein